MSLKDELAARKTFLKQAEMAPIAGLLLYITDIL